ncbi:membrane protein [Azorhizobium oxalatiphilum]|uniref:Membrane protein n=1 Tax=Azorhizobium oxalatiphilum TaxID=980631 RepID=A0A917BUY7_9HYPH|nr:MBL fold metallo-hydrolase [Azorhizobium oxalatiphilum]GGF57242.1 membrane protein [Azorhizobium oxalatiphilum]
MSNPYYSGPANGHFDGTRFYNPGHEITDKTLRDLWQWRRNRDRKVWPRKVDVQPAIPEAGVAGIRATMVGHASVLIQAAGLNILTDPVWSQRVSPFRWIGPKRVAAPGIAFDALPPIHVVLISHNHYDHLDLVTVSRLHKAHRPLFVVPLGNDGLIRKVAPDARISIGDWGTEVSLSSTATATLVPANHWSARSLKDRRMALWCGYVIRTALGLVWFAGDTGYGDGSIFRDIRAAHGAPDLALIPIGAYEPRWFMQPQHINPAEAVQIFLDVGAKLAGGIHWGTFQLTDESREAPVEALAQALRAATIPDDNFVALAPGHVLDQRPG